LTNDTVPRYPKIVQMYMDLGRRSRMVFAEGIGKKGTRFEGKKIRLTSVGKILLSKQYTHSLWWLWTSSVEPSRKVWTYMTSGTLDEMKERFEKLTGAEKQRVRDEGFKNGQDFEVRR